MGNAKRVGQQCGPNGCRRPHRTVIRRCTPPELGIDDSPNSGGGYVGDSICTAFNAKSGWGRIVNISSDGTDGWPGLGPYATAKSGLHGLTRTLAAELGPANILSNVVMPGAVMTERTEKNIPAEQREQLRQHLPTRQLIMPEDVAAVIVFLGSPVNRQIIGEIVRVTGGR